MGVLFFKYFKTVAGVLGVLKTSKFGSSGPAEWKIGNSISSHMFFLRRLHLSLRNCPAVWIGLDVKIVFQRILRIFLNVQKGCPIIDAYLYINIRYLTHTPPHQTHKKSLKKKGWHLYQELCLPRYSSHSYQFFVGPCYHLGYRSQKPLWGVSWDSISHHQQQGSFGGNGVGGCFVERCY